MMKSGSASCQYYCIDLGRQKLAPAVQALSNFTSKPFALSCMHETSQIDAPVAYSESLAAQGGDNPRCLVRNSHRWLAVAFDWLENDGRESPVRREPTSDRGLGSQSQQQRDRQRARRTASWQTHTHGSGNAKQVGGGAGEIAGRFRIAAHSLGWRCRRRVSGEGLQRSLETTAGTELAQAPRLRFEAACLPVYSSHWRGCGQVSPRAQKKLHRILELGESALLVFADESGFSLHPRLGRVWARRGSRPIVPTTSQHHKRLNLFGWVEPLCGWHGLFRWPKGNREGFLALLKYLCHRIKGRKVYLYVDGAPWHKGSADKRIPHRTSGSSDGIPAPFTIRSSIRRNACGI